MDITGFSDIDFPVFGSCDVERTALHPQPDSVQVWSAWLEQSSLYPLGSVTLLQSLPPGEPAPTSVPVVRSVEKDFNFG